MMCFQKMLMLHGVFWVTSHKAFWTDHCIVARHTKIPTILKHGDRKNKTYTHKKKAGYLVMQFLETQQFLETDCCARWPSHYKVQRKSTSLMHFSASRFSAILFFTGYTILWLPDLLISHLASFVKGFYSIRKCFAHKQRKFSPFRVYCFSDILYFFFIF